MKTKAMILCMMAVLLGSNGICRAQEAGEFKPTFKFGTIFQTRAGQEQNGYSNTSKDDEAWDWQVSLQRVRLLFTMQLTTKDRLFVMTEIKADRLTKINEMRVIDAYYTHTFSPLLLVHAGMNSNLSNSRHIFMSAGKLLGNNYSELSGWKPSVFSQNVGRDYSVSIEGMAHKVRYYLAALSGKRDFQLYDGNKFLFTEDNNPIYYDNAPLRYIGRVEYHFLDVDKYWGTNLGQGKTFTIGGGVDAQGTYLSVNGDVYFDYPITAAGSVTVEGSYAYVTGGDKLTEKYNLVKEAPKQAIGFGQVGYYFNCCKLMPWVRYENRSVSAEGDQLLYSNITSESYAGGGLSYFFNGFNTNVKLSYMTHTREIDTKDKTYGQAYLTFSTVF